MNFYFTVDTESSMNEAWRRPERRPLEASRRVFCRVGDQDFGIPLLTRMLGKHGFRGTFFVETLATRCLGEADTRSIFDFLLREQQDVQLHIHPNYQFYSELQKARAEGRDYVVPRPSDLLGHFKKEIQRDLLNAATGHFETFAGYRPTAFRAGCFAASRSTMTCLHELGVRVDSSFNPCYPKLSFPHDPLLPNAVQHIEGVWEIPVTVARSKVPEGYDGYKPADCCALSFCEIRELLDRTEQQGQQHFVMVFHSFSAVKSRDETYEEMKPDWIVIRRLERVFQYLAENSKRFRVETMGNLAQNLGGLEAAKHPPHVPVLPLLHSAVRKAVQGINRIYWV